MAWLTAIASLLGVGFGRLKLYAALAVAVALAVVGIYATGVWNGVRREEARADRRRLDAMRSAMEVEREVNALDTDALIDRASRWLR